MTDLREQAQHLFLCCPDGCLDVLHLLLMKPPHGSDLLFVLFLFRGLREPHIGHVLLKL